MKIARFHIIIDLENVAQGVIMDKQGLRQFLAKLPEVIGMKVLAGPYVVAGFATNPGLTGLVVIEFSHISVHTFSKSRQALVDIFSCRPFDQKLALKELLDYFKVIKDQAEIEIVAWGVNLS